MIWDDFHWGANCKTGCHGPYSAVPVAQAQQAKTVLFATQAILRTNLQFRILTEKANRRMTPWYANGAKVSHSDQADPTK